MAEVKPFRGVHYNTDRFGGDITRFVSPPYDVVDEQMLRRLKEDRLNVTHIILGEEGDGYATASKRLTRWLNDKVLVRDEHEMFYIYEQTFQSPDGTPRVRSGLIALVKLEDPETGGILPHEKTIPKHKEDRLALMAAVGGDTEQIFLLYEDATGEIEHMLQDRRKREELLRFVDADGVHHRVIALSDKEQMKRIVELLRPAKLLIADGHHRYETALEYRDRRRREEQDRSGPAPYDYVMATLVSSSNPGLVIYPTHRLVRRLSDEALSALAEGLEKRFKIRRKRTVDDLLTALENAPSRSFGCWIPARNLMALAEPREEPSGDPMEDLSVYVVQEAVLKGLLGYTEDMLDRKVNIEFVKGTDAARAMMGSGEYHACLFVKPPSVEQTMKVAETRRKMPQKSTYFFPKIWSGTMMYLFG